MTLQTTFLQRTLGRNYKWWYAISYYFKIYTNYRLDTFFNVLQSSLKFLSSILIWFISIKSGSKLDLSQLLTYFLLGNILAVCWSSVTEWFLSNDIRTGRLATLIVRPTSIFLHYFTRSLGGDAFFGLWNIGFLVFLSIIFSKYIVLGNLANILLAISIIILDRFLVFYYQIFVGSLAFWSTEAGGILRTAGFLLSFLSGSLFPFDLIEETKWLSYNPFAYLFYHPMQIYLGKYSPEQTVLVFIGGIAWCIVLYFLAKLVFKLGLKRNESVGL